MSQKTTEILKSLEEGIQSLFESENYKNYLKFMAGFHSYSLNNTLLIFHQFPSATLVAPYREWQRRHRHIRKGESGIRVIAPHFFKSKKKNSDEEIDRLGFHVATTFDVSQTDPDDAEGEIPEICHKLTGNLSDATLLDTLVAICPIPVRFEAIPGSANGYFSSQNNEIVVDNTNGPRQMLKSLIHEQSHMWHHKLDPDFGKCPRQEKEVIAESCAYTVCNYLQIPTDDYSFGYVAGWGSRDMKELKKHLDLIRKISDKIISEIEFHQEQQQ